MNFPLGDTQKVPYSLTELDADTNPTAGDPSDTVTIVSADTDSATIVPDATPAPGTVASGFIVGGKKLQTGVAITATVTRKDGSVLTATDLIDIVPGAASSISLGLGAPVSQ
jgi:hypothetical protein